MQLRSFRQRAQVYIVSRHSLFFHETPLRISTIETSTAEFTNTMKDWENNEKEKDKNGELRMEECKTDCK